jgi:protein O-GlcNAc transferase
VSGKNSELARTALDDARAAWERGDAALAEAGCRDALAADPDEVRAWILLGLVLRKRQPEDARMALAAAIERSPKHPDAWFQLGNLHREARRYREAIAAYEAATLAAPGNSSLLNNLGLALEGAGEIARAEASYRSALSGAPGHRQALANLGHLLCAARRYTEAGAVCDEYVRRFRDAEATVWIDRGICLHHTGDYKGAEASFGRAIALDPEDAVALKNLASLLVEGEDFGPAEVLLTKALARDPSSAYALSLLAHCRAHLCAWDELEALHAMLERLLARDDGDSANAFALLSIPLSPAVQLRAAQRWARDLAPASIPVPAQPAARRAGRLRVGYVSSDLRTHATSSLLAEVWERHDRTRIATYAYSIGPREVSALRSRIEAAFDQFADVSADPVEEIARRIAEDGIDVLIDLNGYTTHSRSEIFALKPAPVQASWLGYLGTLGADWYDCVLTDRFAAPPQLQRFYTERFLYLPDCYCPSDTLRPIASPAPTRAACGLPEQGLVFCCVNSAHKILPEVFSVWMRLLGKVPGSLLWLAPATATARANLRRAAAVRGIAPERLVFAPRVASPENLARQVHADLFLDTTPYNAGATANDALFMGVPVLTCAGETMASRVAGSQLRSIGLPDLVTTRLGDYEALALEFARNPERLARLRARLAANRHSYPLFDMARFVPALDDLLHTAWENRSSSMVPRPSASV